MSSKVPVDYHLLSVNAGLIGAIFIFFSISSMASDFSIFNFNQNECSYGFDLNPSESQIAVTVAVGVILIPFSISSVLILLRCDSAKIITGVGFALIIGSAIMIIASLSCRLPSEFLTSVMIFPAMIIIIITTILYLFKKSNQRKSEKFLKKNSEQY